MASPSFAPEPLSQKRLSLAEIDTVVSAKLGATRTLGNAQPACFNRQVAMYLAARVGRWSTTVIGRFYNGRDHSTVCHGIQRIEELRDCNPEIDALLTELKRQLIDSSQETTQRKFGQICVPNRLPSLSPSDVEQLADRIADRFACKLKELLEEFFDQSQIE